MRPRHRWLAAILAWAALGAHAFQVAGLSPQGEVARVRQMVLKFDDAAVAFGDPGAAAPVDLRCADGFVPKGAGRWLNERSWVFDFQEDLAPGVRCSVQVKPGLKSLNGVDFSGQDRFGFSTGGPVVQAVLPYADSAVDEDQYFALRLSGAASRASLQAHLWCAVDGVGERIAVRFIEGAERSVLLKAHGWDRDAAQNPLAFVTVACNRSLPPSAKLQLVFDKGVATPDGVATAVQKRFGFTVRAPFSASFNCERENAQSACLPIRPMTLAFTSVVPQKWLEAIRLVSEKESFKPVFEDGPGSGQGDVSEGSTVRFPAILPEHTQFRLELPKDLKDESGRALRNAATFPLQVSTGMLPPLAKFPAAPFGVIERFAEPGGTALLPVTLRNVEPALQVKGLQAGQLSDLKPGTDAQIIAWFQKVQTYDAATVARKAAAADLKHAAPKSIDDSDRTEVQTRMVSLLQGQPGVKTLDLPKSAGNALRPFEVVGIPLDAGFHVVEIASQKLGTSLLDARHGAGRTMYVRTSALVTNLAVHFKLGRENALAWVTTLDKGAPVADAWVRVSDCRGREVRAARTDASGIARFQGISPQAPSCQTDNNFTQAYFVSARAPQPAGEGKGVVEDLAFTWSDWNRGIESWRFNLPSSHDAHPDERAHTILDRNLLRVGETLSMKHLIRSQTGQGFGAVSAPPDRLVLTHLGSGQEYAQPVAWRKTATGGQSAESSFVVPRTARLGLYSIELHKPDGHSIHTGEFRVEEFRLPVYEGRVNPAGSAQLVNAATVPVDVQINYVGGGPAANLPVQLSAMLRPKYLSMADYPAFSFQAPRSREDRVAAADQESENGNADARVVADKLPLRLDKNGSATTALTHMAPGRQPVDLLLEARYSDPNGEVQTLRSTRTLWPAAVLAGIKTEDWLSSGTQVKFQALALDLAGKPQQGIALEVQATARLVTSARKRMVGGFYTYDNQTTVKDLGRVCAGTSDSRGLLLCEATLSDPGEVELVVTATDRAGNRIQAASSVYVTKQGELWFGGDNHDRIDVLPEKKNYEPGETARFQVRMPFRMATALLTVEREGVIESRVVQLRGRDPTVELVVQKDWGPNVFVSVMALRGRLREVPWYSFFTWGYRAPREWWSTFWYEGREYSAPTALVDLSKPAYRLGVAEIHVGTRAHQLDVRVQTDKESYPVRGSARVQIQVKLPDGRPAAHAEVALAAVDQALLELLPNESWNVLEAMLQRRSWGVETSTAQMEIIGRRHFGRKAVPAGGGGGHSSTRALLDTLLLWNPRIQLDANGSASLVVPLNDALTTFKIVAMADAGTALFGTGSASIRSTQDLQIISGLPPLVRENDQFRAQFTLRNTSKHAMQVVLAPRATLLALPPQTVDIPAGEAREVAWLVTTPAQRNFSRFASMLWEIEARDTLGAARDGLKVQQRIVPAVPLTVQQASLAQIDGPFSLEVSPPADALPGRGGVRMVLQPRLAEGLPGVHDWFANYPFTCLEQKVSKALGLRDTKAWQAVVAELPGYLDADGLANYFPQREAQGQHGSDTLSAYILATAHEASGVNRAFDLSDDARAPLERGLAAFVEGRIQRNTWSPRKDLDVRKLAALEALSRYGKAQAKMLNSITIAPNQWPTHAVIDWFNILKRVTDVPERDKRLAEASQILRSRISYQGSKMVFESEAGDYWWWLMQNGDVNGARLLLAVLEDPLWKDDVGRLASGFIHRQQGGAWQTTTANVWGALAIEKFSSRLESRPVTGTTRSVLDSASASVDWSRVARDKARDAPAAATSSAFAAPELAGSLRNNSMFLPWSTSAGPQTLKLEHQGSGRPWLTLQSIAAVQTKTPLQAGYSIRKTITPVEQANKSLPAGSYTRGDVLRITLELHASVDMPWVAVTDPVAAGATILGNGLGRDSVFAQLGERAQGAAWMAFEERSFEAFRGYYGFLPKGITTLEYTLRLNNVGDFSVPPSRVEAMYAPEMFGVTPNARVRVEPAP